MRKERKHYTAEEKVAILRHHLLDKVPVPICVKNGACSRRCSTAGKKSSSRTEQLLSRRRNVLAASSPARRAWSIPQRMSSNSPVLCESVEIEISTPAAAACRAVSSTSLAKARILLGLNGH